MKRLLTISLLLLVSLSGTALAQGPDPDTFLFGDPRPDAPELAPRGEYGVGVRTLDVVNPDQIDIVSHTAENPDPLYDRPLTLEVWYPAVIPDGETMLEEYEDVHGRADNPAQAITPFTFWGRASRDAEPDLSGGPYPLVIVSHGFPGSRFMMTYLTENLASKGYVVVAIDHTDSTFRDTKTFASTLLNRPLDILFVVDEVATLGAADGDGFLAGLVDAENTALIGYSMGGYGSLNAAGAGFSPAIAGFFARMAPESTAIESRLAGAPELEASRDSRIKAVVAFAPWGMNVGLWDADGLAGLDVPLFVVVGSADDVAGYENGPVQIFEGAVNAERYLLTYLDARHNVAPNPPPDLSVDHDTYMRYAEPVWNEARINNINQHFVTAFLGIQLKGEDYGDYLDLIEVAAEGVYAVDDAGNPTEEHTYWAGFPPRSALGLTLQHRTPES
mgnify:CR=1 FL=1